MKFEWEYYLDFTLYILYGFILFVFLYFCIKKRVRKSIVITYGKERKKKKNPNYLPFISLFLWFFFHSCFLLMNASWFHTILSSLHFPSLHPSTKQINPYFITNNILISKYEQIWFWKSERNSIRYQFYFYHNFIFFNFISLFFEIRRENNRKQYDPSWKVLFVHTYKFTLWKKKNENKYKFIYAKAF